MDPVVQPEALSWTGLAMLALSAVVSAVFGYIVRHVRKVQAGTAKSLLDPDNLYSYDELIRKVIIQIDEAATPAAADLLKPLLDKLRAERPAA